MKILLLLLSALISSCSRYSCQPSPKSKDYAVTQVKTLYQVTYAYRWGAKKEFTTRTYECLPEGIKVGDTVTIKSNQVK